IAFIAVGLLLLVAGYLSPLPPKRVSDEPEEGQDPDRPDVPDVPDVPDEQDAEATPSIQAPD
ncbi:MAG: hypothetical protein WA880_07200, partial [Ornithinimicrobium sp.]